jgi:hypothetical protein
MKTAGHRKEPSIVYHALSEKLVQGAIFNDEMQKVSEGRMAVFPKGVYHYKTHEEANRHWQEQCAKEILRKSRA